MTTYNIKFVYRHSSCLKLSPCTNLSLAREKGELFEIEGHNQGPLLAIVDLFSQYIIEGHYDDSSKVSKLYPLNLLQWSSKLEA